MQMIRFKYHSIKQALEQIMQKDRDYVLVRHDFPAGEVVEEHFHPNVNEWAVFDSGAFRITIDFEWYTINAKEPSAIFFPKAHVHGLECITGMSYIVVREGNDRIITLDELLKNRKSIKPVEDPCGTLWELYKDDNMSLAYVDVTGTARKHMHRRMDERYRIEKGKGQLALGAGILDLKKGDAVRIPKCEWHYLKKARGIFEVLVLTHPGYIPEDFIAE